MGESRSAGVWRKRVAKDWPFLPFLIIAVAPILAELLPRGSVVGQGLAALLWGSLPYFALAQGMLAPVLWQKGHRGWAVTALVLGLVAFGPDPRGLGNPDAGVVRVAVLNVNSFSPDIEVFPLQSMVAALGLDIAMVVERRPDTLPGLVRVADDFNEPLPRPSFATAVFCRSECAAWVSPLIGSVAQRMPVGMVRIGESEAGICIFGIHAPPPAPLDATGMGPHIRWLSSFIQNGRMSRSLGPCFRGDGVVVAGDLNGVPGGRPYRALLGRGLSDPLLLRGLRANTWPSGGGWPNLPLLRLDHIFVGEAEVQVGAKVRIPGSDHQTHPFSVRLPGPRIDPTAQ